MYKVILLFIFTGCQTAIPEITPSYQRAGRMCSFKGDCKAGETCSGGICGPPRYIEDCNKNKKED